MGLTLVNLHRVVAEEVVGKFHDTHVGLQRHLHHIVRAVGIAAQGIHRFLVVELDHAFHLAAGQVECRMTANLEVYLAVVGVLHVPDDMYAVAFQPVGDGQIETEGIHLQRLLRLV